MWVLVYRLLFCGLQSFFDFDAFPLQFWKAVMGLGRLFDPSNPGWQLLRRVFVLQEKKKR
jgi:hypothetical protein